MTKTLRSIAHTFYSDANLELSNFIPETEGKEYAASTFQLNDLKVIYREGKITPKKIGQFVTFWKRNSEGNTEPLHESDDFDFYIITVQHENKTGQFIFSKSILIKQGIISTQKKEGKRGFRLYPAWDNPTSTQAIKTQCWQLNHFCDFSVQNSQHCLKIRIR